MIIYESPFRLVKALRQFAEAMGDGRRVSVTREISKVHEETVRGTLAEVAATLSKMNRKGRLSLSFPVNRKGRRNLRKSWKMRRIDPRFDVIVKNFENKFNG